MTVRIVMRTLARTFARKLAILIALLALAFEWAGRLLEALLTPKGM